MEGETIHTSSGRALDELNMDAILRNELSTEDLRISGETLRRQADAAEAAGYRQLAENLRRAAELTAIDNEQVLAIYDRLRPGRATHGELIALAERLEREYDAHRVGALIREAAQVYRDRGITKA